MLWFQGLRKIGPSLQRHSYSLSLESALSELFRLYDLAGNSGEDAAKVIDAWIEQSASGASSASPAQGRLAQLLRTRDLDEFIVRDPALAEVKRGIMEQWMFHHSADARWTAVRPKLLAALPLLCGQATESTRSHV